MEQEKFSCVICDADVDPNKAFVFHFNNDLFYFCKSHDEPFKMGMTLGQMEMNSKFLSFISHLGDPVTKKDLKKAIFELTPMTKITNSLIPEAEKTLEIEYTFRTPKEFCDELSKIVIGQDLAKRAVSVSVINHFQTMEDMEPSTHSDKHHVLLLGRSGSGKTLIATSVASMFNLPYVMGDATNYSPTGFHGADAETVLHDLLLDTEMNFELAERGVVFIDEIDKICCSNRSSGRYESFIGSTQASFLKLIEGKNVKIPGSLFGEPPGSSYNLNSDRMLFFFGGAFNGLSEILAKKMGLTDRSLGFKRDNDSKNKEIDEALKSYEIFSKATREEMVDALIEFGMLSEFVGRIPTIVPLKPLSKEDLKKVLLESKFSPVKKQKALFLKSGYSLDFSDEFIDKIVELSYNSSTGTRALDSYVKGAVSSASFDLMFLTKNKSVKGAVMITEDCINDPGRYEVTGLQNIGLFSASL